MNDPERKPCTCPERQPGPHYENPDCPIHGIEAPVELDTPWHVWVQPLFEDKKRVFTGTEAEARKARDEHAATLDNIDDVYLWHGATCVEHTSGTKPYVPPPSEPQEPEPPEVINPEWMAYELALHCCEDSPNPFANFNSFASYPRLFEAWRLGYEAAIHSLPSDNPYPQMIPAP